MPAREPWARHIYFEEPWCVQLHRGRAASALWGSKVQGKSDKAPNSLAYQAQRQKPLHSPSSLYGGRNKRVQLHKDPGLERGRGCVGLGPPGEAEHMQISAPWCSLVSRTFCPGFLPTFQITLSVSYWFLSSPPGMTLAPLPFLFTFTSKSGFLRPW